MTALTDFERRALESMAPLFGRQADAFRAQIASATVTDRENTGVGFFTSVTVDKGICVPVPLSHQGAHFEVPGIEHGMGIVLWDTNGDGYLEIIEGWTVDENALVGVDLLELKFVRLTHLG